MLTVSELKTRGFGTERKNFQLHGTMNLRIKTMPLVSFIVGNSVFRRWTTLKCRNRK